MKVVHIVVNAMILDCKKYLIFLKKQGYTDLQLEFTKWGAFPKDVSQYDLIIHCGALYANTPWGVTSYRMRCYVKAHPS